MSLENARKLIRDITDFPHTGILFRDITPLLNDADATRAVVSRLIEPWRGKVTSVAGMESRGFLFGVLVAQALGVGFVPVRKKGKLPFKTETVSYGLEYGTDTLEIHIDACEGEDVLICDDLIATGGTAAATAQLVERVGGHVAGYSFVIELAELGGRKTLPPGTPVDAVWTL